MSLGVNELEAEAMQLPDAERAELAQRIFASIEEDVVSEGDDDVEAAWLDEADRRYRRFLAGETEAVPAEEALARILARHEGR